MKQEALKVTNNSYLLPSEPRRISFLGFVFVGKICTVLETDSIVTNCKEIELEVLEFKLNPNFFLNKFFSDCNNYCAIYIICHLQ